MGKCWKDYLLSSSIPLEDSVSQILEKMKLYNIHEYNYLRKNENEIDTNFSVDFTGGDYIELKDNNGFYVTYLIECKYCLRDIKWIFMPNKIFHNEMMSFCVDEYDANIQLNYDYWETFPEYPVVGKGTELLSSNCNSNKINKAVNQLSYAYINRYIDHIDHNNISSCTYGQLFFIIPIIVTTADLWKIKDNTTIEMIENSDELSDIAEQQNVLLYNYRPDNMMQNYFREKVKSLDEDILNELKHKFSTNYENTFESHFQCMPLMNPGNILIINYNVFEAELRKLNKFFKNKKIAQKRKKTNR